MASIILSTAGQALGASLGGPLGGFLGRQAGTLLGSAFSGSKSVRHFEGARLESLAVQTSTYGKMIPIVYGNARIAGNILWSRPIKETATTTTSGAGGKGGGKQTQSSTTYSYSVSLAIAICEGPISQIVRVWADALQLDLSQGSYRLYKGDEDQLPDSLIESFEGVGTTPAYRGIAYVVIEDFPLAEFGNRIPNFSFEVKRKMLWPDVNGESVENLITGMVMIPGSGEFVYDTQVETKIPGAQVGSDWAQQGYRRAVNQHTPEGKANALVSLEQLEETCPNVEWIAVVVAWFGDDTDAGSCTILPGVEYQTGATTTPDVWGVAGFDRATARQITLVDGNPQYGGTPDDDSLLRYLDEVIARGYKILFYPLIMMDTDYKPWRGRITGTATDVASFFTKTNGYNAFVTHYASLVASRVDAFVIGSELIGLTKVTNTPGNYPAVNALVSLAATVKGIVGSGVKVTYAADWSEYHHTDGGWYNLDPLWASPNIDMIGIDAYFPLTDLAHQSYDIDVIKAGWTSGEGYDWYYSDSERTVQSPLTPEYAWKNLEWFWSHTHTNPDSSVTAWVPESKKLWFTEFGFPSVDGATNQPNVFYDPTSLESYFPYHSQGRVDFRAQRVGLVATLSQWQESDMLEQMFVWTWDARPYPYWPDLTAVWTDGGVWKTGHWVMGKLGLSQLAAIVSDLCLRTGLTANDIDVNSLTDLVEGYVIVEQQSVRACLEQLQQGYFFDAVESDSILKFVRRNGALASVINPDHLLPHNDRDSVLSITRAQEVELPQNINLIYIDRTSNYQPGTQQSQRAVTGSRENLTVNLPLVFTGQYAKNIADTTLYLFWLARTTYELTLPSQYFRLEPTDCIQLSVSGVTHNMRILETQLRGGGSLNIKAVAEDIAIYDFYAPPGEGVDVLSESRPVSETRLELLDTHLLPYDVYNQGVIRCATAPLSDRWSGSVVYRSDNSGSDYSLWLNSNESAIVGNSLTALPVGTTALFDETNSVIVGLSGDAVLYSASEFAVLNGANVALVGDEIIQFRTATLLSPGKYQLSNLLRGRLGTEFAVNTHVPGERFVLLDARVLKQNVPLDLFYLSRIYKPVSIGSTLGATEAQSFTYQGTGLKPYSPVHVAAIRDGSGNITLSWVRRSRLGGPWTDYVDVPLLEAREEYEVEILNGGNVVRTILGLFSPTVSYTAIDQTADFGSPQSSLNVRIYQISAQVGRGYEAEATV